MSARDGGDADGAPGGVGVVLVSHSAPVAESVAAMAVQLAGGTASVAIRAAGGTADGRIGTSSELITQAARQVDAGSGVVLIADLGSAVLTVKALLEDDELPSGARLVDAPFVEGAVAAVVTASTGADVEAVASAASDAYSYRKT
ncbi:PTS fructose transporter subunit IIA [Streptomyces sp. ICBB 8177]|uniref:PTS-dependent dihydroxyacetone kinase phosphotransferase subunit DhaM n=1 Tax=Streptomyces sp. ICBB 8177 TaxID=563922 RepID=UPI000D6773ED|nr:PTS fructose transporter subunit IIA [Streptomyces sp. ICBB 8177]PWI41755.1 PTS fructose transporter subunit IIA [Streptomyces sp. ICBB 8177]